ncbi:MAG: hypothetical protein QOJ34_3108, partial [Pseudonocardiales bacterium]|nr:hypothetical protein [Pseudonocardiales bacterium]
MIGLGLVLAVNQPPGRSTRFGAWRLSDAA